jgi:hypothetical protein
MAQQMDPGLQQTTPQERRAAQHPGNAALENLTAPAVR